MSSDETSPPSKEQARREREAAALRANLQRRKAQSRAQSAARSADAKPSENGEKPS